MSERLWKVVQQGGFGFKFDTAVCTIVFTVLWSDSAIMHATRRYRIVLGPLQIRKVIYESR
jgi:hypothetical protein